MAQAHRVHRRLDHGLPRHTRALFVEVDQRRAPSQVLGDLAVLGPLQRNLETRILPSNGAHGRQIGAGKLLGHGDRGRLEQFVGRRSRIGAQGVVVLAPQAAQHQNLWPPFVGQHRVQWLGEAPAVQFPRGKK